MPPGRHPHAPKDEQRASVEAMCSYGVPHADIATILGIDAKTLRLHYRRELDLGKAKANEAIGRTLFQKAMAGDTASLIYWTKSQMGWSEKQRVEVQQLDANGNPCDPGRLHVTVELLGDAAPARLNAPKIINAQSYAEAVELIG